MVKGGSNTTASQEEEIKTKEVDESPIHHFEGCAKFDTQTHTLTLPSYEGANLMS